MSFFTSALYRHGFITMCCLSLLCFTAHARTAKNNLAVSAVVPAKVQLSTSPMDFGIVPTTKNTLARATASITVNMVATQVYHITLDAGLHKLSSRRMRNAAGNTIAYDLYQNNAYTTPWGDAGYGNTFTAGNGLASTGTGQNQVFTVYGQLQILPTQAGSFSDTITVTVHY